MATLGQQAVGTVVKIKENTVPQEWIVMHHGDMPAFGTSLEASSGAAGGTWLLRKNIVYKGEIWEYTTSTGGEVTYENSPADTYLTNTFLPTISSEIRNQILTVSIEISYLRNERTWDKMISRKVFLPDLNELENTWGNAPYDGSASYIATYNGAAADYWLRNSPRVSDPNITWNYVRAEGKTNSHKVIYRDTIAGYRPFIVVNSGIFVTSDGTVTVNTPPVISGSNGGLGTFGDTPPSYRYTVTDAQGGAVSVSERVDGTTLRTYQPSLGSAEHGFHPGEHLEEPCERLAQPRHHGHRSRRRFRDAHHDVHKERHGPGHHRDGHEPRLVCGDGPVLPVHGDGRPGRRGER